MAQRTMPKFSNAAPIAHSDARALAARRIGQTGKSPEQVKPEDAIIATFAQAGRAVSRQAAMGFWSAAVEDAFSTSPDAISVSARMWYAGEDYQTHAPRLIAPCKGDSVGKRVVRKGGKDTVEVYLRFHDIIGGKTATANADSIGALVRDNPRRGAYLALLKVWGITEKVHRARFDAYQSRRKVAADSVVLTDGTASKPSATATATAQRVKAGNNATVTARTSARNRVTTDTPQARIHANNAVTDVATGKAVRKHALAGDLTPSIGAAELGSADGAEMLRRSMGSKL